MFACKVGQFSAVDILLNYDADTEIRSMVDLVHL